MRNRYLASLAATCLCVLGCGGDKAEVHGTVSLNGTPIEEGAINFIPVEGTQGPGVGATIHNGEYHIPRAKGVVVGKNRVELRAFRNTGKKVKDPTQPGALIDERVLAFPPEYNDRSTLVREVTRGSNKIDFDIKITESGKPTQGR